MYTELFTEGAEPLAAIDPDAYTAATYTSSWVSVEEFHRIVALVAVGDMASSATLNAKVQQATSAAGAGAKDITGKAITEMTQAGGDGNTLQAINVASDELDVDGGFSFVRLSITVAVAAVDCYGLLLGTQPRYAPVTQTSYGEVIS